MGSHLYTKSYRQLIMNHFLLSLDFSVHSLNFLFFLFLFYQSNKGIEVWFSTKDSLCLPFWLSFWHLQTYNRLRVAVKKLQPISIQSHLSFHR